MTSFQGVHGEYRNRVHDIYASASELFGIGCVVATPHGHRFRFYPIASNVLIQCRINTVKRVCNCVQSKGA